MQTMAERISWVVQDSGLTKTAFSDRLNVSQAFISQLCSGVKTPSDRTIADICREFYVREDWLRTGQGQPYSLPSRDNQIAAFIDSAMSGEDDNFKRRLISVLSRLNEGEWGILERRLREIVGEHPEQNGGSEKASGPALDAAPEASRKSLPPKSKRGGNGMVEIMVYDQPAAAGLGNYLDEPEYHIEQYPDGVIPDKADFGIVISGDSMEPKVHNGGTVFVQAALSVDTGKIGIFVLNGQAFCKKLAVDHTSQQVRLVSLNPKYEDIIVKPSDSFRTVGRVLGQWTLGYQQDIFGW